jgi:hypothetical protein
MVGGQVRLSSVKPGGFLGHTAAAGGRRLVIHLLCEPRRMPVFPLTRPEEADECRNGSHCSPDAGRPPLLSRRDALSQRERAGHYSRTGPALSRSRRRSPCLLSGLLRSRLDEKNRVGQHFALKFLQRRVLGDAQVREDKESAVHTKDSRHHGGNAWGTGAQRCPKNEGCGCWLQFDGTNLFAVLSPGKCCLSSRRSEVAHPIHDPIRGDQVAFLILDENGKWGHDGLATFASANREQGEPPDLDAQAHQR